MQADAVFEQVRQFGLQVSQVTVCSFLNRPGELHEVQSEPCSHKFDWSELSQVRQLDSVPEQVIHVGLQRSQVPAEAF